MVQSASGDVSTVAVLTRLSAYACAYYVSVHTYVSLLIVLLQLLYEEDIA